jgi:hypothetical protein
VLRTRAEPDERNIGMLASRNTADFLDGNLTRDHVMTEANDHLGE